MSWKKKQTKVDVDWVQYLASKKDIQKLAVAFYAATKQLAGSAMPTALVLAEEWSARERMNTETMLRIADCLEEIVNELRKARMSS